MTQIQQQPPADPGAASLVILAQLAAHTTRGYPARRDSNAVAGPAERW